MDEILQNLGLNTQINLTTKKRLQKYYRKPIQYYRNSDPVPLSVQHLQRVVNFLKLLYIENPRERFSIFVNHCKHNRYTYNTTKEYIKRLRRTGLFLDETTNEDISTILKLSKADFNNTNNHCRLIDEEDYKRLAKYICQNINTKTMPILVAMTTMLRTMEVLQFTTMTLDELSRRQQLITSVRLKNTQIKKDDNTLQISYWQPIYSQEFIPIIEKLIEFYDDEIKAAAALGNNYPIKLFPITSQTLVEHVHLIYWQVFNRKPPHGFGIHSFRYMNARLVKQMGYSLDSIQKLLQHKHERTTKIYLRNDMFEYKRQYKELFDNVKPLNKIAKINRLV